MALHNDFGKFGEIKAKDYLVSKGYRLRDANWVSGKKELDIVAEKDNVLIIVEVKSRGKERIERIEELLPYKKQLNIMNAAQTYINQNKIKLGVRFDLILVGKEADDPIEHIEDIFFSKTR